MYNRRWYRKQDGDDHARGATLVPVVNHSRVDLTKISRVTISYEKPRREKPPLKVRLSRGCSARLRSALLESLLLAH